jgi:hypothetical protein
MDTILDDQFVVYVRKDPNDSGRPDLLERELLRCGSYAEARRVQREYGQGQPNCVIRYVGPAGGGD